GDGRNGSWAATQGFQVAAVDISRIATEKAIARDRKADVAVRRIVADVMEWHPREGERFDLIALLYLQGPADLRLAAFSWIAGALAPGGWFLVEGFARGEGDAAGLGPKAPDFRWSLEECL